MITTKPITLTESAFQHHVDNYDGFCLGCRTWTEGDCEPDMRRGRCPSCDTKQVYGAEELLIHGVIVLG